MKIPWLYLFAANIIPLPFAHLAAIVICAFTLGGGIGVLYGNNHHDSPKFTEAIVSKVIDPSQSAITKIECIVRCTGNECKLAYRTTKGKVISGGQALDNEEGSI